MAAIIKINHADNVAVAVSNVTAGEVCQVGPEEVTATADIPAGHKIALEDLAEGADVIKYGYPIGHLLEAVPKGGLVDHRVLKTLR